MADIKTNEVEAVDTGKGGTDSPTYWKRWITMARKGQKTHRESTKKAWEEYENAGISGDAANSGIQNARSYPIYWSSCKTLEPAYYSRTPKLNIRREFGIDDEESLTAVLITERLGDFLIKDCDFDNVMSSAVMDFIHGDKATAQVLYEADERRDTFPLFLDEQAKFVTADGQPYDGETEETEEGFFGVNIVPINQVVKLKPALYDECIHTPHAKNEEEITEKGYYFLLTRKQAEEAFDDDVVEKINWAKGTEGDPGEKRDYGDDEEGKNSVQIIGEFVEGWECWCESSKKVYWYSNQYDGFLKIADDPYKLKGFFPSPSFIISSKPSKTLFPTPSYVQLEPIIKELHKAQNKVINLISAIRRRAIVDGDEELLLLLNAPEGKEYIIHKNIQTIIDKGGLDNMIMFIPLRELVESISELSGLQEKFKNEFFEWFGVPDILRGATDPIETATAQKLKSSAAHDRFKYNKKLVQQLARDSIEMMIDLALGTFTTETLAEICGFQFMNEDQQASFESQLELLRSDRARFIRIDIETDSLSFIDEQLKADKTSIAVQTLTQGLDKVAQMVETSPEFAQVGLQALLMSLESLSPGDKFEEGIRRAIDGLIEKSKEPPPPPPDYEQMKIEVKQHQNQIKEFEAQSKAQKDQADFQIKQAKFQLDTQKQVHKQEMDQINVQVEQFKVGMEAQLQQFMMQIEQQRVGLEAQSVKIEEFKAGMQAAESKMEEIRLAREADSRTLEIMAGTQQMQGEKIQEQKALPPPNITVNSPPVNVVVEGQKKASRKVGKAQIDNEGNAVFESMDVDDGES
ncbi:MAG: hypothetical protein DRI61_03445 [Chloroflexi bacterium]|nr:MAG: hypothetical protein DRI61_03445 [Chloroflexota bacterium]